MICSSSTTCSPERTVRHAAFLAAWLAAPAMLLAPAGSGLAAAPSAAGELIVEARDYLSRHDGIAAEVRLKEALGKGAPRKAVAAYMGEALLVQDEPERARPWLEPGQFTPSSAAAGFRALAALEREDGDLFAAGKAYDRALAITPKDPGLWVEIGRLRYVRGDHLKAIAASDYALRLDPSSVRALEFRGQLVRDRDGLVPSLGWFEKAHREAPDDLSALGEYAATLGETGRTVEMLKLTRRMLELDPGNSRAYYLQAAMAARAGRYKLARKLLDRTGDKLEAVPGAMLLRGILEVAAGNFTLAIEALEPLVREQPGNARARNLLARAIFLSGEYRYLVERFGGEASQPYASPYLQALVARAYENLGERGLAAPLLDNAARADRLPLHPVGKGTQIGELLAHGQIGSAEALAGQWLRRNPGYYDHLALAGDVQLAKGNAHAAMDYYEQAARIRMPESLMARRFQAMLMAGKVGQATALAKKFLADNPCSTEAARLAGWLSAYSGDWRRARRIYEYLRATGGERDVQLLSDLALAQIRTGDAEAAEATARQAYRLQRSSPVAAQAWALSLVATGKRPAAAAALLEKARVMMGDSPLLAEGRRRLAAAGKG